MPNNAILNAAYQFAKKAHSSSHPDAKDQLQELFPSASWDDVVEAYLKACELVEKSYEIAEKCRLQGTRDEQALEVLASALPGFSPETYRDALALGWFASR